VEHGKKERQAIGKKDAYRFFVFVSVSAAVHGLYYLAGNFRRLCQLP
jgi:hypothetical protein